MLVGSVVKELCRVIPERVLVLSLVLAIFALTHLLLLLILFKINPESWWLFRGSTRFAESLLGWWHHLEVFEAVPRSGLDHLTMIVLEIFPIGLSYIFGRYLPTSSNKAVLLKIKTFHWIGRREQNLGFEFRVTSSPLLANKLQGVFNRLLVLRSQYLLNSIKGHLGPCLNCLRRSPQIMYYHTLELVLELQLVLQDLDLEVRH